jgi:CRP-like cAMP-binding protein
MVDPAADLLAGKLKEHSRLTGDDVAELERLTYHRRSLQPNEDFIRQGDRPDVAALVLTGMVARYHLLKNGGRQYLSFNIAGDLPDAQSLFLDRMDHAVCALDKVELALMPHKEITRVFERRPAVGLALWRETLIDAAIFRETITNNSGRPARMRMAHLFCELFYRARASGLTEDNSCSAPLSQVQIGEALGMAIATVNRTLQSLRRAKLIEFRGGVLIVRDWKRLTAVGDFNPGYLQLKRQIRI